MSLNTVRTGRSHGFKVSARSLGLVGLALGLGACDVPPEAMEGEADVEAISAALMPIVSNARVADRVPGSIEMVFSLTRLDPPAQATTAFFSTMVAGGTGFNPATAGSACTAGVDYVAVSNRPITFAAGSSTTSTTVTVCGDDLAEAAEHLFVKLVDANGQCEGERCVAIGTITNDPGLSINDAGFREPLSGGRSGSFTVTLSQAVPRDVTFTVSRDDDTAVSGFGNCSIFPRPDYMGGAGTFTIPAGALTATVNVTICGGDGAESSERFFLRLSNPVNATLADSAGIGTIGDTTLQPVQPVF